MKIIKISEVAGKVMNDDQRFVGSVNFKNLIDDKISQSYWVFSADFAPGHRSVPHTHNTDQLLYFTEGKGIVGTDTKEHEVTAGTLVFIPAGQQHYHGATSTTSCSHLAVLLEGPDSLEKE